MTKFRGRSSTLSTRSIWRRKDARRGPPRLSSNWNSSLVVQTQATIKAARGNTPNKPFHVLTPRETALLMCKLPGSIIHSVILKAWRISSQTGRAMRCLRRSPIRTVSRTSILPPSKQSSREYSRPIRQLKDSIAESTSSLTGCSIVVSEEAQQGLSEI